MKFNRISFTIMTLAALLVASLEAAPRRLSNLGESNSLTDKMFNTGEASSPRGDEMFGNNKDRIKFGEWHGSYSNIGEKRADSLKQRGGKEFSTNEVQFDSFERKEAHITLDADDRKMASVQNWNRLRDNVMSHKFSGTEMNTPEAKRFSEMVDEVSLRDINRFQFWKNKTDAGLPVQVAGSDDAPALSSEQRRVMARIKGDSVAVTDYEEQGAEHVTRKTTKQTKAEDESSFIESLFDW